jgi:glycopeptide antibiotics resistance protein
VKLWLTRHRLALWVLVIIFIVFPWRSLQNHSHLDSVQWVPFVSPPVRVRDIVGNIALYIPFGWFYMRRDGASATACMLSALVLSFATEASQLFTHNRFPSVQDLLMNVAGAVIGVAVDRFRHNT